MDIQEYRIESDEFQPITPLLNGAPHLTGVSFAIMLDEQRPLASDFSPAVALEDEIGVMTGGRPQKATWHVWYRISDVSPEDPWVDCGPVFRTT